MSEKPQTLAAVLNDLWHVLATAGVKDMPRLVFDDFRDWMPAADLLPFTGMPFEPYVGMLCGFRLEYARKPVNEADRFVAQEIGA